MSKQVRNYLIAGSVVLIAVAIIGYSAMRATLIPFVEAYLGYVDTHNGIIVAIATIAVAAFTWQLWVSTNKLWLAGEKQLKHSDEVSSRQLRAYIGVDEMPDTDMESRKLSLDTEGHIVATGVMKNFGATPAFAVTGVFGVRAMEGPLTDADFKALQDWTKPQVFQPGQQGILTMRSLEKFDQTRWQTIQEETKRWNVFVYGKVFYCDTFKHPHYTKFCFKIDYRKGLTVVPGWDWNEDHNETDDKITKDIYPPKFVSQ